MSALIEERSEATLVDLLDRLLAGGVVLVGDITLSLADIELVRIRLMALITAVATIEGSDRGHP
jgi:hypothetical protein